MIDPLLDPLLQKAIAEEEAKDKEQAAEALRRYGHTLRKLLEDETFELTPDGPSIPLYSEVVPRIPGVLDPMTWPNQYAILYLHVVQAAVERFISRHGIALEKKKKVRLKKLDRATAAAVLRERRKYFYPSTQ